MPDRKIAADTFDPSELPYVKLELWDFYKTAVSDSHWQNSFDILVALRNQLLQLVTCAEELVAKNSDQISAEYRPLHQTFPLAGVIAQREQLGLKQNVILLASPMAYLQQFFEHSTADDWKTIINEMFEYALYDSRITDVFGYEDVSEKYELLDGLLDAFYLLSSNDAADCTELVEFIKVIIKPALVYRIARPGAPTHLLVVDEDDSDKNYQELQSVFSAVVHEDLEVEISIVKYSFIYNALQQGSFHYLMSLMTGVLVYQKSTSRTPNLLSANVTQAVSESDKVFNLMARRATQMFANAQADQNENELSMFLAHQSIELSLRGLSMALRGKEKKAHDLFVLLKYCAVVAPELKPCFSTDVDRKTLGLLNESYRKGRYGEMAISSEDCQQGKLLAERFLNLARKIYQDRVSEFKQAAEKIFFIIYYSPFCEIPSHGLNSSTPSGWFGGNDNF